MPALRCSDMLHAAGAAQATVRDMHERSFDAISTTRCAMSSGRSTGCGCWPGRRPLWDRWHGCVGRLRHHSVRQRGERTRPPGRVGCDCLAHDSGRSACSRQRRRSPTVADVRTKFPDIPTRHARGKDRSNQASAGIWSGWNSHDASAVPAFGSRGVRSHEGPLMRLSCPKLQRRKPRWQLFRRLKGTPERR